MEDGDSSSMFLGRIIKWLMESSNRVLIVRKVSGFLSCFLQKFYKIYVKIKQITFLVV